MRSAHPGDAPRHDLSTLGDERRQHPHIFVINIVDLLDAETAHFLAPEVLLLGSHRLVAAGGPLRRADGTSASCFSHSGFLLPNIPIASRPERWAGALPAWARRA